MLCAPTPDNEAQRQAALDEHEIVDTEPEASFDALARLAAHVVGTPMALVSIISHERQWFKAKLGIEGSETSRSSSFCGHVVASGKPLGICVMPGQAAALDGLLWSFEASEFIPHRRWDGATSPAPGEVLLVQDAAQLPHRGLLLNLAQALPAAAFEFERVLEVVGQSPEEVQAGRVRYRAYKQSGASLDHFTASG